MYSRPTIICSSPVESSTRPMPPVTPMTSKLESGSSSSASIAHESYGTPAGQLLSARYGQPLAPEGCCVKQFAPGAAVMLSLWPGANQRLEPMMPRDALPLGSHHL